jgi:hypothetical protein
MQSQQTGTENGSAGSASGWAPLVTDDEVAAFVSLRLSGGLSRVDLETTRSLADFVARHSETVSLYAAHVSGNGWKVHIQAASGSRCDAFVTAPDGEDVELGHGTIQHGYYAGQVDYKRVIDEMLQTAKNAWADGERNGIEAAKAKEYTQALASINAHQKYAEARAMAESHGDVNPQLMEDLDEAFSQLSQHDTNTYQLINESDHARIRAQIRLLHTQAASSS